MRKQNITGILVLLLTSIIWGVAFVAQSVGTNHLNAFAFNCIRNSIGVVVLLPVLFGTRATAKQPPAPLFTKDLLLGGLLCGISLFMGANFQQLGITYSTVGKSAFITTLYIIFVPILGIFLKKKAGFRVWCSVLLAMSGLFLLCMKNEVFVLEPADIYLLLSAFFFAVQILCVDHFVHKTDAIALSIMQFFVTAVFSGVGMLFTEIPTWTDITNAAVPLLYAGAISSGVGFTLQIIGQKMLPSTVASLIMSLESVMAALAGWLLLQEVLSEKEIVGCALVFAAIILTQLPLKNIVPLLKAHKK